MIEDSSLFYERQVVNIYDNPDKLVLWRANFYWICFITFDK
jgi:hypothetical protein